MHQRCPGYIEIKSEALAFLKARYNTSNNCDCKEKERKDREIEKVKAILTT